MITRALVFVICVFAPTVLFAGVCTLADSESSCQAKIKQEVNQQEDNANREALSEISQKNTGESSAIGDDGAVTVNDFASKMRLSVDSGSLNASDSQALSFEWTNFLGLGATEKGHNYKLQVRLGGGELYQPLNDALGDAARASELEGQLGDADNVVIGFSYNIVNGKLGRNPQTARAVFADIMEEARLAAMPSEFEADKIADDSDEMLLAIQDLIATTRETTFDTIPDTALAKNYVVAYENAIRAEFASLVAYRTQLRQLGFYDLVDLVDNQPQLSLTFGGTVRDELAGPDELSATFSYEKGFVNVNGFRKHQKRACQDPTESAAQCLSSYLTADRRSQLERGDRVAVSLEYSKTQDYDINLSDDNVALDLDGQKKFIGSVSYGRYLAFGQEGTGRSRLDLGLSYEDVSSDPSRQDRGMGTVTFSQRVAQGSILSFSLVYASKPEFRGDVDEELSARVGLNYKFASDQGF